MASLLPLASFVVILLVFQKFRPSPSWRSSFLSAALVCGILVTAFTEFLSLFRQISFSTLLALWGLSAVVAVICLVRLSGAVHVPSRSSIGGLSPFELSLLGAVAIIIAVVGVIAWLSPPNNWDSMTYHMSRVAHWAQNRSVESYPTTILRQLYQNPAAEFAILQFRVLTGGDRFANLIQWFSMIGSTIGVSLIAKELGARARGQIFAAVFAATIPMGILQASSTQNDYVLAFWLVCVAYYAILLKRNGSLTYAAATGASLGLAILTKGTAYVYALPFMIWVSLSLLQSRRGKGAVAIVSIVAISLVVNAGHYSRNYEMFGSPLSPEQNGNYYKFANDIFTVPAAASNVIRNVGLQIGTPFGEANAALDSGIYKLDRLIGADPNDKRTTWPGTRFHVPATSGHEDLAGNPLHILLIAVCIPFLLLQRRDTKDTSYYSLCVLAAFLLFSVYLKWQPWNSRLQLPLFVLWSPVIGLFLSEIRHRIIAGLVMLVLIVGAVPWVVHNSARPLIGERSVLAVERDQQYFTNRPSLYAPYLRATEFISSSQCSQVGLMIGGDDWEYPFWALLGEHAGRKIRLEHVTVANISEAEYNSDPFRDFDPCAVIVVSREKSNEVRVGNNSYLRASFADPVGVFVRR